jgi:hypothetical protein
MCEGRFIAEVEVELLDDGTGWAPYLSVADARKLDKVRIALRRYDLKAAAKFAKVYELTPVPTRRNNPHAPLLRLAALDAANQGGKRIAGVFGSGWSGLAPGHDAERDGRSHNSASE